jgi:16S rRNA (guanine527-N7)-methyltransferase
MSAHPLEARLREGLQALGLPLSDAQVHTLLAYQDWVAKWNKVYNLTAVRDPQEMLTHHLLDSLAVIAPLRRHLADAGLGQGAKLLDVGSGAGLPGVVIAIACPEVDVSCVDTVAKKALFIQQVAAALRLPNLHGVHARVESLTQTFDVVTSRAFASLLDFTTWSRRALAEQGVWLAMKGKHPADELAALPVATQVFHVEPLQVPGLDAERCLLWLRPAAGHGCAAETT